MTVYWCELAWLGGPEAAPGVVIEVEQGGICAVTSGHKAPPPGTTPLPGLTLPALANAHSHAFHRALRSRTQGERGTFWTWRDLMYRVSSGLDPDNYYRLARAVFAEMAMAGIGVVGEFHYVHHRPGGGAYDDPNAMGASLAAAATDAGIRLTLLDTLYLHGGLCSRDGIRVRTPCQRNRPASPTAQPRHGRTGWTIWPPLSRARTPWWARRSTRCAPWTLPRSGRQRVGQPITGHPSTCTSPSNPPRTGGVSRFMGEPRSG